MHPYLQSTKLPIQKMRRRRNLDGALAPRRRERPRGRTGVIPVGVMRLIRSAPAHARATEYPLRLTDFRHASPACDRTYNRSRAARRVGSRPLKRICWPGATTHLSGGLRGTVCRTVRRVDRAAGPPHYGCRRSARCARPRQPGDSSPPRTSGIASGSDGGLTCELPLPTASLLAPDRLLQARRRTFCERPTLLARLDVGGVDLLKCNPGSVE